MGTHQKNYSTGHSPRPGRWLPAVPAVTRVRTLQNEEHVARAGLDIARLHASAVVAENDTNAIALLVGDAGTRIAAMQDAAAAQARQRLAAAHLSHVEANIAEATREAQDFITTLGALALRAAMS